MKILICTNSIGANGGIERVTIVKANALSSINGNEVHICFTDKGSYPETIHPLSNKVHVHDLKITFWDSNYKNFIMKLWKLRKKLKSVISELNPDIIITTGSYEKYALFAIKTEAVKVREYHFNSNYRTLQFGNSFKIKLIEWFENTILSCGFDKNYLLTKENLIKNFKNKNKKFDYQHNPCSFPISETIQNTTRENVIIAVGRFAYQKNFKSLIRIWSKCYQSGWVLRLIGEGPEKAEIENMVKQLGLSQSVEFMGFRKDIPQQLDKAKIIALTSRYEGMPLNLIEAMSRGVVPISYSNPYGPRDIITDGDNGILVEYMNESEYAEKLSELMNNNNLQIMSTKAHQRSKDFSIDKITEQWMVKYNQLINDKRSQ